MGFDSDDIWHDIPVINITNNSTVTDNSIFRINLDTFVCCWESFPSMSTCQKRDRLSQIFNIDYFNSDTVLTNKTSIEKLKKSRFYDPSPSDQSGFIYIYTFEDNVLAGLYEQGFFWWKTCRYEAKLKIGRTEQNVFRRIEQQFDSKTGVSEPPILLAVFWTKLVVQCEREIHNELIDKRLKDKEGNLAKGGVEWFKDTPAQILPIVLKWVKHFNELLGYHPETGEPIYAKLCPYGSYIQLGDKDPESKKNPKQSSLPKGMKLEDVTVEIALDLLKLPRDLGIHPETGGKLQANLSPYGSYILHDRGKEGKEYQWIKAPDNVLTITLERAIEVLAASRLSRSNRR